MRKLTAGLIALTAALSAPAAAGAAAAPDLPGDGGVPTSCEIQEYIGVVNVRACEDYPS